MGLFGLFASLFGFGSMIKNQYDQETAAYSSYQQAIKNGDYWYYVGNEKYSTELNAPCEIREEKTTGNKILYDKRSGMMIENLTYNKNQEKEKKYKAEAEKNNCKFYKTSQFNTYEKSFEVYVNEDFPGKYYERQKRRGCIGREYHGDLYIEREVEIDPFYKDKRRYKFIRTKTCSNIYLPSGELFTTFKENEMIKKQAKENAIRNGDVFYHYIINGYLCIGKKVGDDKTIYYYNPDFKFYTPGIFKSEKYVTQMDPENKIRISFFIKPDENMKDIKYKPNGMKY